MSRVERSMKLVTISAILSAVHAPIAVVASGVVVDVVEGHGEDVEKLEQQLQPSFYNCYASKQSKIYKCPA